MSPTPAFYNKPGNTPAAHLPAILTIHYFVSQLPGPQCSHIMLPQHKNTSKKDKILQRPDNKNSKWLKSPNAHGALCFHKETKKQKEEHFPVKKTTQKQRRILWVDTQVSFTRVAHTAKKPKTNSDMILTCSTCCTLTVGSLFLH